MIKKYTTFLAAACVLLLQSMALTSCVDDQKIDNGGGEIIDVDDDDPTTFDYPTYVGNIDPEVKTAVDGLFTNIVGSVAQGSHVVMLGNINEVDPQQIRQAYERGAIIAVTNPVKEQLDAFSENNSEWLVELYTQNADGLLLYAFNRDEDYYTVSLATSQSVMVSTDEEIVDENVPEYDPALDPDDMIEDDLQKPDLGPHSQRIAGWVALLNHHFGDMGLDGESAGDKSVLPFFQQKSTPTVNYDVHAKHRIRKSGAYVDSCAGKASVSIHYDYSMVHVYQGEEGAGDYYIMQLVANVNNSEMWNGNERRKNHVGAVTKICGWLLKGYSVQTTLVDSLHNEVKTVSFAPGTDPKPGTDVKTGTNTIGQSFSVNAGASISGGWSQKDKFEVAAKANVSVGWTWNDETSWSISEMSVSRNLKGTSIGWRVDLDNYPTYKSTGKVSDLNRVNKMLKGDTQMMGTWVWKDTETQDNVRKKPYALKCEIHLDYFARSHVYSATKDCKIQHDTVIYIPFPEPIQTRTAGFITLKNNFDDITVYDLKVIDCDKDSILRNERNSFPPGASVGLGQYSDLGNYSIKFRTRTDGTSAGKEYQYNLYKTVPVEKGRVSTVYTKTDFAPIN